MNRLLNLILAIGLAPLLILICCVVAIMVRVKLGTPVFFFQERAGRNGRPFTIIKFRTMTNELDEAGSLLPSSQRLTSFGRFLRRSNLDELPELFNILKGEMNFVGPRPLLMDYVGLYSPEQALRLDVPPGLTGWAQINGRNKISWEKRFEMDVWYVKNQSLLLDLKILALTAISTLQHKDVGAMDSEISKRFKG